MRPQIEEGCEREVVEKIGVDSERRRNTSIFIKTPGSSDGGQGEQGSPGLTRRSEGLDLEREKVRSEVQALRKSTPVQSLRPGPAQHRETQLWSLWSSPLLVPMRQTDLKIIIVGALGVGKTSLLHRYIHNIFNEDYSSTLGANVQQKRVNVDGQVVRLQQVWDPGAQERFRYMISVFCKGLDGCILTFDLADRDSFWELESWRQSVLEQSHASDAGLPFVVLGNKADVKDRQVSREEAEAWCEDRSMAYLEVSAKDSAGVEQAFAMVAGQALSWHKEKLRSCLMDSVKLKPDDRSQKTCCVGRSSTV
ncbi:ras-related protein Rab-7b-like [Arapaima gigas]